MARGLRSLMLALVLLLPAGMLQAQDSSSVYNAGRPGAGGSALEWIFGRKDRPSARIVRVPQQTYQPRRRSIAVAPPVVPAPVSPAIQPGSPESVQPADPNAPLQAAPPSETAQPAPIVEPPKQSITIAVVGDSLSLFLAQGLQETYLDQPHVAFVTRIREASGLVRDDYFDWSRQLRDLIASTARLDAIVIQIGSNDRQPLRDAEGEAQPRSARWLAVYTRRIDEVIGAAREKNIPLIWVGMPPMRAEKYSADMLAFNALYKAQMVAAGMPYIDIWEPFTSDDGTYAVNGPDVEGAVVRLRTADGVHFTKAGARKMAFFADRELKKILALRPAPGALAAVAPPVAPKMDPLLNIPLTSEPPPIPNALKSADALIGIPLPDPPLLPSLVPRPAQGAVTSLHVPASSPGGQLVTRKIDWNRDMPPVLQPKAGRADDFRASP